MLNAAGYQVYLLVNTFQVEDKLFDHSPERIEHFNLRAPCAMCFFQGFGLEQITPGTFRLLDRAAVDSHATVSLASAIATVPDETARPELTAQQDKMRVQAPSLLQRRHVLSLTAISLGER